MTLPDLLAHQVQPEVICSYTAIRELNSFLLPHSSFTSQRLFTAGASESFCNLALVLFHLAEGIESLRALPTAKR